jgi:hypothetical protein
MTLANIKSRIAKFATKSTFSKSLVATVGAGALLFAAPTKSDAQVVFRVGFRRPVYAVPAPVVVAPAPYGYYARRDAYIRHEEWLRAHRYDRYPYGYR